MSQERNPLLSALFEAQRMLVYFLFKVFYGLRIRGEKYIPRSGPAVLCPNHQAYFDGLPIGFRVPSPVFCAVESLYFHMPLVGWWLRSFGGIPLGGRNDRRGYEQCRKVIRDGAILIIFPEGRRSRDGSLTRLRQGAARVALTSGAEIVPVTIVGAFEAWPKGRRFPLCCKPIIIKFYPPIRCEVAEKADLKRRIEEVNAELERIMTRRLEAWRRVKAGRAGS